MMQFDSYKKTSRGFNLLELMIVVTIIGLLIAAMVIGLSESRDKAYNKALIQQVNEMVSALEIYFTGEGEYPTGAASPNPSTSQEAVTIYCIGEGKTAGCIPGGIVIPTSHIEQVLMPQYLARIPHTEAGQYSSLAYHRCTNQNPSDNSAINSSCRGNDFSIWYVLKGNNRDCGRGRQATSYTGPSGEGVAAGYTLCRMQATK